MATVLVIGASRGIGLEFVRQYAADGQRVIASARGDEGLARIAALGARPIRLDVTDPTRMSELGRELPGERLDIALYVAGVYSTAGATEPPTRESFDSVMHVNVLGAMQAIPRVAPLVEAAGGCFGFISSHMGRIAGVRSSFGWTYRASKAALNMVVASAQNDYPRATLVAIDPGWVRTDMGGPSAPLSAEQSVSAMRRAIGGLGAAHRGRFIHYDGQPFDGW